MSKISSFFQATFSFLNKWAKIILPVWGALGITLVTIFIMVSSNVDELSAEVKSKTQKVALAQISVDKAAANHNEAISKSLQLTTNLLKYQDRCQDNPTGFAKNVMGRDANNCQYEEILEKLDANKFDKSISKFFGSSRLELDQAEKLALDELTIAGVKFDKAVQSQKTAKDNLQTFESYKQTLVFSLNIWIGITVIIFVFWFVGWLLQKIEKKNSKSNDSKQKSLAAQLRQLAKLHKDGVLSDSEFEHKKKQLLDRI